MSPLSGPAFPVNWFFFFFPFLCETLAWEPPLFSLLPPGHSEFREDPPFPPPFSLLGFPPSALFLSPRWTVGACLYRSLERTGRDASLVDPFSFSPPFAFHEPGLEIRSGTFQAFFFLFLFLLTSFDQLCRSPPLFLERLQDFLSSEISPPPLNVFFFLLFFLVAHMS